MRKMAVVIVCLIFASLTFAQTCPEQTYLDPSTPPFPIDPNMVPIDPISGQSSLIGFLSVDVGVRWSIDGWGCDEDGDSLVWTVSKGTLTHPTPDTYTLTSTQTFIGVEYIYIAATDIPSELHQTPIQRIGTIAVRGTKKNTAPVIGCGTRPTP